MFSVSHMINSSEKMWLHENISPFFISLVLNFHSFSPLTRSSTLILFCYCEVYICRCECIFGAIELADSRRFEISQRFENPK